MKNAKKFIMWALTLFMIVSSIAFLPSVASVIMLAFAVIAAPIGPWQEFLSGLGIRGWLKGIVLCAAFIGAMATVPTKDTSRTVGFPDEQPSYHGTLPSRVPAQDPTPDVTESSVLDNADTPTPTPTPSEAIPDTSASTQTPSKSILDTPAPVQSQASAPAGAPVSTPSREPTPAETSTAQNPIPVVSSPPVAPPARQTQAPAQSGNQGGGGQGNADNFNTWDNQDQQNTSAKWVLNTNTMKIHYPSCSDVRRIAPHNYSTSNLSEAELLAQGYTTCGRCH